MVERACPAVCAIVFHEAVTGVYLLGGLGAGRVVMWDLVGKRQVASLSAHTGVVTSLAVLGGTGPPLLLTAGADRAIKLWG